MKDQWFLAKLTAEPDRDWIEPAFQPNSPVFVRKAELPDWVWLLHLHPFRLMALEMAIAKKNISYVTDAAGKPSHAKNNAWLEEQLMQFLAFIYLQHSD